VSLKYVDPMLMKRVATDRKLGHVTDGPLLVEYSVGFSQWTRTHYVDVINEHQTSNGSAPIERVSSINTDKPFSYGNESSRQQCVSLNILGSMRELPEHVSQKTVRGSILPQFLRNIFIAEAIGAMLVILHYIGRLNELVGSRSIYRTLTRLRHSYNKRQRAKTSFIRKLCYPFVCIFQAFGRCCDSSQSVTDGRIKVAHVQK
jgi:hypothetical protein